MVAQTLIGERWTVEQYLDMERGSALRHELIDGRVYAMAGGTQRHDRICLSITRLLDERLEGHPCRVFTANMKVRLANDSDFVYPDAAIICDARDLADDQADFIAYPRLIVEVLSDSTERYDRGPKFELYCGHGTLEHYVLIGTRRPTVEVRSRTPDGEWTVTIYSPGDMIVLPSMGLTIPVDTVYRGIAF